MKYKLIFSDVFERDLKKLKKNEPLSFKKAMELLPELESHPKTGIGVPKPLKGYGNRSIWSRRINIKHRLVYEIIDGTIEVHLLSSYGHYDDK